MSSRLPTYVLSASFLTVHPSGQQITTDTHSISHVVLSSLPNSNFTLFTIIHHSGHWVTFHVKISCLESHHSKLWFIVYKCSPFDTVLVHTPLHESET